MTMSHVRVQYQQHYMCLVITVFKQSLSHVYNAFSSIVREDVDEMGKK